MLHTTHRLAAGDSTFLSTAEWLAEGAIRVTIINVTAGKN